MSKNYGKVRMSCGCNLLLASCVTISWYHHSENHGVPRRGLEIFRVQLFRIEDFSMFFDVGTFIDFSFFHFFIDFSFIEILFSVLDRFFHRY